MPCRKCLEGIPVHSFDKLGVMSDGKTTLYYTKPSIAVEDHSPDNVADFISHFEDTRPNNWFWIFDCKGMKSKDFISNGSGRKMTEILQTPHYSTLSGVFIVNATMTMKVFLGIIKPFLKRETTAKIHLCSSGLISFADKLQSIGSAQKDIQKVINLVNAP